MSEYHKIQTVYLRDPATNHKTLLEGVFSKPEFEFLRNAQWQWTEKVDGTNIRVMLTNGVVSFGGKTDNAQIPAKLIAVLQSLFTVEAFEGSFDKEDGKLPDVCLYGEGYGAGIAKGGNYRPDQSFILFDVKVGDWWLEWPNVIDVANKMGIEAVPVIGYGTLEEAISNVKAGVLSTISQNREYIMEGLVLRPATTLFNRKGERVITKIKHKDFA